MHKLKTDRTKTETEIILNGPLTIGDLAEVKELFLNALSTSKSIVVDLSQGESFDLAFLQMLIALHKSSSDKNISFRIEPSLPQNYLDLINDSGTISHSWLIGKSESEIHGGENE